MRLNIEVLLGTSPDYGGSSLCPQPACDQSCRSHTSVIPEEQKAGAQSTGLGSGHLVHSQPHYSPVA